MDKAEATRLVEAALAEQRREPYAALVRRIDEEPTHTDIAGVSATYQLEVEVMWEYRPGGNVLVRVAIDDGSFWAATSPLTRSFIKTPDDTFVGE
jgi:hypothetical protein